MLVRAKCSEYGTSAIIPEENLGWICSCCQEGVWEKEGKTALEALREETEHARQRVEDTDHPGLSQWMHAIEARLKLLEDK